MALGGQKKDRPHVLMFLNKAYICTDTEDAVWFISKSKCDKNVFWCQNKHKTYSLVLMYIGFCGATYSIYNVLIMMRQFHIVFWKTTHYYCWGSRQKNTLLELSFLDSLFHMETSDMLILWIPSSRSSGSLAITLWFHQSLT